MRRILLTAGATLALSLMPAGAAMAHGHRHGRHHHHSHLIRFAHKTDSTPTPATQPTQEPVATIASFSEGVLTLKLADGSTVSGKVTEETRIECPAAGEEQGDDDNGQGDDRHDDSGPSGSGGDDQGDDMHGWSGDDGHDGCPPSCGTSALVEGAKVASAELRVGSGGAVWEEVRLLG